MPSRASIVFALFCATLAAVTVWLVTHPDGDPDSHLKATRDSIGTIPLLLEKHTVRIKSEGAPKSEDPRAGFVLEKPDGTKLVVEANKEIKPRHIELAADSMMSTGRKSFVSVDSAWSEIEPSWKNLTWSNSRLAQRLALAKFPSKPTTVSSYDWEARYNDGEFTTEEALSFNLRRAGYAGAAFLGTFLLVVLSLAACGWLWRALLARVRELSRAMRGKDDA